MNFLKKAIVICVLLNASLAHQYIDLKNSTITYEWVGDTSEEPNINSVKDKTISDIFNGEDYHRVALLHCDFTVPHPEYCNLTIQTHTFDNAIHQTTCIVTSPSKQHHVVADTKMSIEHVKFLRQSSILIGWTTDYKGVKDAHRIYYHVISTDTCKASGFAAIVALRDKSPKTHSILAYDEHFDVVFHDKRACKDRNSHYRVSFPNTVENFLAEEPKLSKTKFTSNYDSFILNEAFAMRGIQKDAAVVVGHLNVTEASELEHVYSPITGWTPIKASMVKQHVYSNSSGHATLCWSSMNKQKAVDCTWLDGSRDPNDTMSLRFSKPFERLPYIHNKPDGSVLMVRATGDLRKSSEIVVDQGYMNGQCKRLAEIEVRDVVSEFELSVVKHHTYCVSYIGKKIQERHNHNKSPDRHTFVTRCVKGHHEKTREFFDCGDHKYYV